MKKDIKEPLIDSQNYEGGDIVEDSEQQKNVRMEVKKIKGLNEGIVVKEQ